MDHALRDQDFAVFGCDDPPRIAQPNLRASLDDAHVLIVVLVPMGARMELASLRDGCDAHTIPRRSCRVLECEVLLGLVGAGIVTDLYGTA